MQEGEQEGNQPEPPAEGEGGCTPQPGCGGRQAGAIVRSALAPLHPPTGAPLRRGG